MDWLLALLFGSFIASATVTETAVPPDPTDTVPEADIPRAPSIRPCPVGHGQPLRRNLRRPFHDAVYLTADNTVCQRVTVPHPATPHNLTEEDHSDAPTDTQ